MQTKNLQYYQSYVQFINPTLSSTKDFYESFTCSIENLVEETEVNYKTMRVSQHCGIKNFRTTLLVDMKRSQMNQMMMNALLGHQYTNVPSSITRVMAMSQSFVYLREIQSRRFQKWTLKGAANILST